MEAIKPPFFVKLNRINYILYMYKYIKGVLKTWKRNF